MPKTVKGHVSSGVELVRVSRSLCDSRILSTAPSTLAAGEVGAAFYVIQALKRVVSDRYDTIRENVIERIKAEGRVQVDPGQNGKASGYLDGWAVSLSIVSRWLDAATMVKRGMGQFVVHRTGHVTCTTCGGTGTVKESVDEVDLVTLEAAVTTGRVDQDEVTKEVWTLRDIVPPSSFGPPT